MYNPGDYAVVSRYGVCRIDSVGHPSLSCANPSIDYYTLSPVNEDCVIYFALNIEREAGYYECKSCHHRYVPDFSHAVMAMHIGRSRLMKCPSCGKRTWQKKVLSR